MENYSRLVENEINLLPNRKIIVASQLYNDKFNFMPEDTFYKIIQRLSDNKKLDHLTKGIYSKPQKTEFGLVSISDEEIVDFYTSNKKGLSVGYALYNKKGITSQTSNKFIVYSNNINEKTKTINNVKVNRLPFKLNDDRITIIEILEIIQNYNNIEDADKEKLKKLIIDYSKKYNEKETKFVIKNMKYKKSTIASLKNFLDYLSIKNALNEYLSSMSKYKLI